MAIQIGDEVYVPRRVVGLDENAVSPFLKTVVRARQDRSVRVDLPNGHLSAPVATSKISESFGVLIVRIGDYNEDGLLDPLAKSVLHYCRMLLPWDSVRLIELRTEGELRRLWNDLHNLYKQVILVGHGSPESFMFGEVEIDAAGLVEVFQAPNPVAKEFISLGCQTGYGSFARAFSLSDCVSHLIAPFHSVHGCVASLFTKTYLHERLLAAYSAKVAFNHARKDLLGAASFRLWKNGKLAEGQR